MTWLVIGKNGQLGRALAGVLADREINYLCTSSSSLDIRFKSECLRYIATAKPSVVVNTAAWTDVDGAESNRETVFAINAEGARSLAIASRSIGAKFIQVSTDYVFSGKSELPRHESSNPDPISVYGKSKAAGEDAVIKEYGLNSYIFRTAWLYSSWSKNFAKTMTRLALSNSNEVRVVNDQFGQPTSAIDLANQIVNSVVSELPAGIYHATNSGKASWYEFAQEIFKATGQSPNRIIPVTSSEIFRLAKRPNFSMLGHEGWNTAGLTGIKVPAMRDWQSALLELMPDIIRAVQIEMENS